MSDTKELKDIKPEIREMADKIKAAIKLDGGTIVVPTTMYTDVLPETITAEQIKAVQKHNSVFFPAATLASGELANQAFKKNKELESVAGEYKMVGRDTFDVAFNRSKEQHNPSDGTKSTVYCDLAGTKLTVHGSRVSRGDMAIVKQHLQAKALASYGEKTIS